MNSLRYIFPLFTSVAQDQPALRKDFTHCRFIILGIGLLGAASTSAAASRPMQPDTTSVFYPLTIGNYWEYYEYASFGGGIVDTVTRTVTGYTTIGSRAYAVIEFHSPRYDQVSNSFERVDSLGDVYSYSSGGDLLEYRVSDTSVTPWAYGSVSRRWNENVVDTAYGRLRQILVALTYQPLDTLGVFGFGTGLMEGIGMTWSLSAEGGGEVFKGAKIDGVVYGTVTSVDEQPA